MALSHFSQGKTAEVRGERSLSTPDQDNAAIRSSARVTIATFWIA